MRKGLVGGVGHKERGRVWNAGALGKSQGEGKDCLKLDQQRPPLAVKGVKPEGSPDPQSLRGSLPPRLFTYEVAHRSRIGIPVTLPKRHGSPREPGPGNPPPQLSGSRLHPLGVPGSSSSPELFPGSGWRLRVLPVRYGAPGTRSLPLGRGHGGGDTGARAPATRRAELAKRRCCTLQVGLARGCRNVEPARGTRGAGSGPRGPSRPHGAGPTRSHRVGIRDSGSDPAAYWADCCLSLRLLHHLVGKKIEG